MLLLTLALCLSLTPGTEAQQWTTANQITVVWDAVTVPTGTVTYQVYTKLELGAAGSEVLVKTVTPTQVLITFLVEGRYFIGVKAVRTVGGVDVGATNISWSSDATACLNGVTFGAQYYVPPGPIKNLRIP